MRNKSCNKGKFRPYNEVTAKACEDARNGISRFDSHAELF
nr:MAG TPA: hypothetical protein [Caudoviricetes sp.]